MTTTNQTESEKTNQAIILYNTIPSVFWTIINCLPLAVFCYGHIESKWLYGMGAFSLLALWLPTSFLAWFQLGKTTVVYKKIGVRFVKKFTKEGDLVNELIRKTYPKYNLVENRQGIRKQMQKTWTNEKLHVVLFLFFLFCAIYALNQGFGWWALAISLNNLIFNIYPIFLQQYTRLRLTLFQDKIRAKMS